MYKILITSSNQYDILKKISQELVNQKLSPCTHIIKNIESFYLWENNLVNDNENLLLIKCSQENLSSIENLIIKKHNYDTPEIICHEFSIVSEKYKKWFNQIK